MYPPGAALSTGNRMFSAPRGERVPRCSSQTPELIADGRLHGAARARASVLRVAGLAGGPSRSTRGSGRSESRWQSLLPGIHQPNADRALCGLRLGSSSTTCSRPASSSGSSPRGNRCPTICRTRCCGPRLSGIGEPGSGLPGLGGEPARGPREDLRAALGARGYEAPAGGATRSCDRLEVYGRVNGASSASGTLSQRPSAPPS